MGVVIGETCEIGDNVTIYQGVTLEEQEKKKESVIQQIKDNVLIATGAKVLRINYNWRKLQKLGQVQLFLKDVPPNSTVVGIPGRSCCPRWCKD